MGRLRVVVSGAHVGHFAKAASLASLLRRHAAVAARPAACQLLLAQRIVQHASGPHDQLGSCHTAPDRPMVHSPTLGQDVKGVFAGAPGAVQAVVSVVSADPGKGRMRCSRRRNASSPTITWGSGSADPGRGCGPGRTCSPPLPCASSICARSHAPPHTTVTLLAIGAHTHIGEPIFGVNHCHEHNTTVSLIVIID